MKVPVQEWLTALHAKRVAAGRCRHCDGAVPCWSEFGDQAVGKRHTTASLRRTRQRGLLKLWEGVTR